MIKKVLPIIIKVILFIVLLYFVWRNSHWSVALALTLISMAIETTNYNVKKLRTMYIGAGLGRRER